MYSGACLYSEGGDRTQKKGDAKMRRRFCRSILMTVLMFISVLSFSGLAFAEEKIDISNANRIFDYNFHAVYDGTPKSPRIMVMWGWNWGTCLKEGVDYTVEYQKQTLPGRQYSYTVKGIGKYTGTYTVTGYQGWVLWYQIQKADFSFPGYSATYEADSDQVGRHHWILNKKVPYDYNLADMFKFMKDSIGDKVARVQFTNSLANHPVCLSSEGDISVEMEKVLSKMPDADDKQIKAETVLEINVDHPIAKTLGELFETDKDKLAKYSRILYAQACLINGMPLDNPSELSDMVCSLMV